MASNDELKSTLAPNGEDVKSTAASSDDLKPTLAPSGEDDKSTAASGDELKPTLASSGEDVKPAAASSDDLKPTLAPSSEDDKSTAASGDDDVNAKVMKQIEYYFGDVNLQRDKFLQDQIKLDHGWVPIDVLLTFNRLKQITEDKSAIAAALKDSELVDVSEDNEKLRRNPEVPIPENSLEFWQEVKTRTVYIKGFTPETTLDNIMDYLKKYGDIVNVVMRKLQGTKTFKGSVFATFKTKENAENFVKNEDAQKYQDVELSRMMQVDYWSKKIAQSKENKAALKALKQQKQMEARNKEGTEGKEFIPRGGRGRGKRRYNKGRGDHKDEKRAKVEA